MAKQKVFAPYDQKLQLWMQPMFFLHAGQAERTWAELANDPQTVIAKHPADFSLYQIGEYEDSNGILSAVIPPVLLMSGLQAKDTPQTELPLRSAK